jgi:hypothetical protein
MTKKVPPRLASAMLLYSEARTRAETFFAIHATGQAKPNPSQDKVLAEETRLSEARNALLVAIESADMRDEDGDSLSLPILLVLSGKKP